VFRPSSLSWNVVNSVVVELVELAYVLEHNDELRGIVEVYEAPAIFLSTILSDGFGRP
jgi:hypothetical protein